MYNILPAARRKRTRRLFNRALVEPVGFVAHSVHCVLEGMVHRVIRFENPRCFTPPCAACFCTFADLCVEHCINSGAAIVRQQTEHDDSHHRNQLPFCQQVPEAWQEAPAPIVDQALVDVRQREGETDRATADFGDEDEVRVGDLLEISGEKVELCVGHFHKAPVLFPCSVVEVPEDLDVAAELCAVAEIHRSNQNARALAHGIEQTIELFGAVAILDRAGMRRGPSLSASPSLRVMLNSTAGCRSSGQPADGRILR